MRKRIMNCKIVKDYLKGNNLTIKKFCEMCNIKYYQFRQFIKDDLDMDINVIFKIASVMNIKVCYLFVK